MAKRRIQDGCRWVQNGCRCTNRRPVILEKAKPQASCPDKFKKVHSNRQYEICQIMRRPDFGLFVFSSPPFSLSCAALILFLIRVMFVSRKDAHPGMFFGPTAEIKGNFSLFSDRTPNISRNSPGFYYKSRKSLFCYHLSFFKGNKSSLSAL